MPQHPPFETPLEPPTSARLGLSPWTNLRAPIGACWTALQAVRPRSAPALWGRSDRGREADADGAERGLTAGLPPHALPIPARSRAGIGALARRGLSGRQSSPAAPAPHPAPCPLCGRRGGGVGLAAPRGGAGRAAARSRSAAAGQRPHGHQPRRGRSASLSAIARQRSRSASAAASLSRS